VTVESGQAPLGFPAIWPAPAKLNLCLHIVGRRPDGYHLLQSAIQFIDLCDELTFWRRPAGVVERLAGPDAVPPDLDLTVRAAKLLAAQSPVAQGVGIGLHKRIPMQAGLGGGSSDAATVLVALNHLWGLRLPEDRLAQIALKLGADVPVFLQGRSAWVEGIGEVLTPADFDTPTFLVIKPRAAVSTAEIFGAPELTRNTPVTTIRAFREQGGRNDCTAAVSRRYPDVAAALEWLNRYGAAKLTGTGACVFAEFATAASARDVLARLPADWHGFIAQGMNRSPLLDRLAAENDG
jgi:4-diphosphocytidyl-2-C-methyl-D-erythritol kinase